MGTHVIVGAGSVGTAAERRLVDLGHEVVMVVTRSGSGPEFPDIR
jgi:Trk K+ transport system NAD-binding subunit